MKTKIKLLTLVFFLSLSTFSNAQEATLEETVNWLEDYGVDLLINPNTYESIKYFINIENDKAKIKQFISADSYYFVTEISMEPLARVSCGFFLGLKNKS